MQQLFLHEEIMLLALRDREGTIEFGSMYQYALGGAILAEMLLNKQVAIEDKVLLIFTRKIYPEVNPAPEREILERLHKAIFTDANNIDARTIVLLSLAKSADLLRLNFDKKELKTRKDRINRIVNGEITGAATKEAIEALQTAVMVAAIMPAIVATTTAASN
jgi:hypothetical protein